ncbi:MAG: flagellar protein FlaG [Rugosibacter sp.]|jgi:flagellar protein FlaG|nr:flagellar protein FlaG [Rugosibacter sp.]MDO9271817.1 flagellar protein FlaG [Rugosibacter sp.]
MDVQNINLLNQNTLVQNRTSQPAIQQNTPPNTPIRSAVATDLPAKNPPSSAQLEEAVTHINQVLQQTNRNLEFSVDDTTKRVVVKVVDTQTGELIRQMPSEETLAISRAIGTIQKGLLLKKIG